MSTNVPKNQRLCSTATAISLELRPLTKVAKHTSPIEMKELMRIATGVTAGY